MTRRKLTTTQRGYGHEHQQARARAVKELRGVGTLPCPFCGRDMDVHMSLDYDHYPPLVLGGGGVRRLTHAACNRRAGQVLGQERRKASKQPKPTRRVVNSQRW